MQVSIYGCSRTDKSVHANIYYFHFLLNFKINNIHKLIEATNSFFFGKIKFLKINLVKKDFHARFSCKQKVYQYKIALQKTNVILEKYFYEYLNPINKNVIQQALKIFEGTHNFLSFSSSEFSENVRNIKYFCVKKHTKKLLVLEICADGFLKYMVRKIIYAILLVNENKISINTLKEYLENPIKNRIQDKLPGHGLYLTRVKYK